LYLRLFIFGVVGVSGVIEIFVSSLTSIEGLVLVVLFGVSDVIFVFKLCVIFDPNSLLSLLLFSLFIFTSSAHSNKDCNFSSIGVKGKVPAQAVINSKAVVLFIEFVVFVLVPVVVVSTNSVLTLRVLLFKV
jgi:hypothetical protein